MYEITRKYHNISIAHYLPFYDGKCKNMHGHNYDVIIKLRYDCLNELRGLNSDKLNPKYGMIMDFKDIDDKVKPVLAQLDHTLVNDLIKNPTAENIAHWIYNQLNGENEKFLRLPCLYSIKVFETSDSSAEYWEDKR